MHKALFTTQAMVVSPGLQDLGRILLASADKHLPALRDETSRCCTRIDRSEPVARARYVSKEWFAMAKTEFLADLLKRRLQVLSENLKRDTKEIAASITLVLG